MSGSAGKPSDDVTSKRTVVRLQSRSSKNSAADRAKTPGPVGDYFPISLDDKTDEDSQAVSEAISSMYDSMKQQTEKLQFHQVGGSLMEMLRENGITTEEQRSSLKSFLDSSAGLEAAKARSGFEQYLQTRANNLRVLPSSFFPSSIPGHETIQDLFIPPPEQS